MDEKPASTNSDFLDVPEEGAEEAKGRKSSESPKKGLLANILELMLLVLIAFALAWLIKSFVVQPFFIPSASMEPTLVPRDHVLVNKFIYRFQEPTYGDIMVFAYPLDPTKDYIKRMVGKPGDRIRLEDGVLYRNGHRIQEDYRQRPLEMADYPGDGGDKVVPDGHYFVMGDNRANSEDSRVWGFLPEADIVGKAFVIYFPFDRLRTVP